jgi:HSP20 family protein
MTRPAQVLPVRLYQTEERIMLAAPMPGLEAENILVRIDGTRVIVHGEERGPHQRDVPLAIAEWSIGPYHREIDVAEPVDGSLTNATYGNGVLVLSMPKVSMGHLGASAEFRLITVAGGRGERVGHIGREAAPHSTEEHWEHKHAEARPAGTPRSSSSRRAPSAYRRILVPLDGSPEAEAILPLAEGLVDRVEGDLVLLRILIPFTAAAMPELPSATIVEATYEAQGDVDEYLSRLAQEIRQRGVRVQTATRSGDPARRIIETAGEMDAALIAMTTHGRSGLSRVVFGSVAESVAREASVPVLLVRAESRDAVRHAA